MHIYPAYCAVRDQDVCIEMSEELPEERKADLQNLAIMCMKYSYGPICTSDFCPNFGSGLVGMGVRPSPVCPTT
jgi:hypothetical protein